MTIGHYPICVLNIDMPTNTVDVNVHPNKLEVRFSDEHLVYENVCGAVADSFSVSPLKSAPHMTLTREVPQTTLNPSVVQVIDTQTESGIEQAREQTKTEARRLLLKQSTSKLTRLNKKNLFNSRRRRTSLRRSSRRILRRL